MPFQGLHADPFIIPNPDSTRHYRWLSDDPRRMALWLRSLGDAPGYRLERGASVPDTIKKADSLGFPEDYVDKAKNVIRFGQNVLASIPMEEAERRTKYLASVAFESLDQAEDQFMAQASELPGVTPFKDDPEAVLERKKHALRADRPFSGQVGGSKTK